MEILEGLNEEQLSAVKHGEGPMLVVAGAGTGKTQVISRRIALLISQNKARPSQILSLTFTEKAAREMEERLYSLIGWQSFQVPVMTFNAFGAELLARYSSHIGRSTGGGLLTSSQKALLLQQHIEQIDFKYYGAQSNLFEFAETIVAYIEKLQNAAIEPEDYISYVESLRSDTSEVHPSDILEQEDLAAFYSLYEDIKMKSGTYDYYDQLSLPVKILRLRPNLASRLSNQYRYILVDEYQDTSPIQDELLRSFVPVDGNIFAVGDDDQSIYSFRGADIDNILSFTSHFSGVKPSVLVRNYRSGQPILDAAYKLIQGNNPDRLEARLSLDKRLVAQNADGKVTFRSYESSADERTSIAIEISERIKRGLEPSDIAVLARSNAPLKALAKNLKNLAVPFLLSADVDIFTNTEVINLWYLLQWIGGKADFDAVSHVLIGPFFRWSSSDLSTLINLSKNELISLEEALRREAADAADVGCQGVVDKLDSWRKMAHELPVSQIAYTLIFEGGLADKLRNEGAEQPRVLQVFEDMHRLLSQMQDYEMVTDDTSLHAYVATFPVPPKLRSGELLGDENGVQLLTVHASKGLEFEVVYIINCTQRSWSEQFGGTLSVPEALVGTKNDLNDHEQRRLMYVAATRAKSELYVSAPSTTTGGQKSALSPYVTELIETAKHFEKSVIKMDKSDILLQKLQRFYPLKSKADTARLPFERSDGWLQLGVGAMQLYGECPYDFFLQNVLGIKQPFGVTMAFGSVIHKTIQAYYGYILRGEAPQRGDLNLMIDNLWHDAGYSTKDQSVQERERAHNIFNWFFAREENMRNEESPTRRILGSEFEIMLEIPEAKLRLKGRIDAYFDTEKGVEIRDFKTGRGNTDGDKLLAIAKSNFQLRTYALAYKILNKVSPSGVTLDYVGTRVEATAQLSDKVLANHRDKLIDMTERIRKRDFAPAPESPFHHCAANKFYGDEEENSSMVVPNVDDNKGYGVTDAA